MWFPSLLSTDFKYWHSSLSAQAPKGNTEIKPRERRVKLNFRWFVNITKALGVYWSIIDNKFMDEYLHNIKFWMNISSFRILDCYKRILWLQLHSFTTQLKLYLISSVCFCNANEATFCSRRNFKFCAKLLLNVANLDQAFKGFCYLAN